MLMSRQLKKYIGLDEYLIIYMQYEDLLIFDYLFHYIDSCQTENNLF
jgi:hypothetical protein